MRMCTEFKRGATLIELLFTMVFIGFMVFLGVSIQTGIKNQADRQSALVMAESLVPALDFCYENEHPVSRPELVGFQICDGLPLAWPDFSGYGYHQLSLRVGKSWLLSLYSDGLQIHCNTYGCSVVSMI